MSINQDYNQNSYRGSQKSQRNLLADLEQQIAKIERFVIDLQQEQKWQNIFYNQKLYLNLNVVFNHNYNEYNQYLEDIIKDYKILKKLYYKNNTDLLVYYLQQIQNKIFSLFKILRSLKKYSKYNKDSNFNYSSSQISYRQEQANKLTIQKDSVLKMLKYIDIQYNNLNQKFLYNKNNNITDNKLQDKLLNLLAKKGELEQELFSITERLKLYN